MRDLSFWFIFCFLYTSFFLCSPFYVFFFFNDTATTEIYTLSLHDALPIFDSAQVIGIVFVFFYCFNCSLVTHIPSYLLHIMTQHFGNRRCPASATNNCKFWLFHSIT